MKKGLLLGFILVMVFTLSSCSLFSKGEEDVKTLEAADTYVLEVKTEYIVDSFNGGSSYYVYTDNVNEVLCTTEVSPDVYTSEYYTYSEIVCTSYLTEYEGDLYTIYDDVMFLNQDNDIDSSSYMETNIEADFMNMLIGVTGVTIDDKIIYEKEMNLSDIPQRYVDMFDFTVITGYEDVVVDVKCVYNTETEVCDYYEIDYTDFIIGLSEQTEQVFDVEYVKLVLEYSNIDLDFALELNFDDYQIDDHPNDLADASVVGVANVVFGEPISAILENEFDLDIFYVSTDGGTFTVTIEDVAGAANILFRIIYGNDRLEYTTLDSLNSFTHTFEFNDVEEGFYIQIDAYLGSGFALEYTLIFEQS